MPVAEQTRAFGPLSLTITHHLPYLPSLVVLIGTKQAAGVQLLAERRDSCETPAVEFLADLRSTHASGHVIRMQLS
jgi:hypothetical protein